jgi:hypothetical protein
MDGIHRNAGEGGGGVRAGAACGIPSAVVSADDVTLCGGFGGVERGWKNVTDRLGWVSQKYADGTRTREEISRMVGAEFAYLVQKEVIRSRVASQAEPSTQELRATMVFRRGGRLADRASPCGFTNGDKAAAMMITTDRKKGICRLIPFSIDLSDVVPGGRANNIDVVTYVLQR